MKFSSLTLLLLLVGCCVSAAIHITSKSCVENSDTTYYTLSSTSGVDSAVWVIADSLSSNSTVHALTASHIYSAPGRYNVQVTYYEHGVPTTIDSVFSILTLPQVITPLPNINHTQCLQQFTLNAATSNPGSVYLWNTGATTDTISSDTNGTYWVRISNQCGAITDTAHIEYNLPPRPYLNIEVDICYGQPDTLYAGPASNTYVWEDGSTSNTLILKDDTSAFAQYYVTESNNCGPSLFEYTDVRHHHKPYVNLGPPDTTICNLKPLYLHVAFKDAFIQWQDGSSDTILEAGHTAEYSVTISNACGVASDSILVLFQGTPNVHLGNDTTICKGQYLAWNVYTLGATYLWWNGTKGPLDTVRQSEKVFVTVKDNCGTSTDTVNVRVENLYLTLPPDTLICSGAQFTPNIFVDNTTRYKWSTGSDSSALTITKPGTYAATVTNQCGVLSDSFKVNFAKLYLDIPADTLMCYGTPLNLNITIDSSTTSYHWSTGSNADTITITEPGTYTATVQNECGTLNSSIVVQYHSCYNCTALPDAFSPNGDGKNDVFRLLPFSVCVVTNFDMKIFNRWGELIFESTDPKIGWDGTYKGRNMPMGSYAYVMKYDVSNGSGAGPSPESKQGNVTLIR